MIVKREEIAGYRSEDGEQMFCLNCEDAATEAREGFRLDHLILHVEIDDGDYYFCDHCKADLLWRPDDPV